MYQLILSFLGLLFGDVVLGGYQPHLGGWFETDEEDTSQQRVTEDGEESEEIQAKIHKAENDMSENRMNTAAIIEKRKLFFERPENSFENFFDLAKDSKKSGMSYVQSMKQFFWVVFIMSAITD